MIYADIEQRSAEWLSLRRGSVTSSRLVDVLKKLKNGGEPAGREHYKLELVWERLNLKGDNYRHAISYEMQQGMEFEILARAEYEMETGNLVTPVGFVSHPEIEDFGASTDGLVGEDGLVEFKCPEGVEFFKIKLAFEREEEFPAKLFDKYCWQLYGELACTGREWADFVVYNPTLPRNIGLIVKRVYRDDGLIRGIECDVRQFLSEVDELVRRWAI